MKKLYSLLFALLAFAGMANAQVTFDFLNNNLNLPLSYNDENDKTTQDLGNVTVIENEGVTITFDNGTATTNSRVWNTGSEITLRVYNGSSFTISAEQNIVNITFTGQASKFGLKSSPEGLDGQVWTGSATSVTFSPTKTNQIRSIIVTLEGGEAPVVPTIDWTSSLESPLTVAQALEKAAQLEQGADSGKEVFVKGKICKIDEISPKKEDGSGYGNATYYISDDGSFNESEVTQLEVYRGFGLKGADFTSEDDIVVGDEVIIGGTIKNYSGTLEFTTGSKIYSLNGDTGSDEPVETQTIAQIIAGGAVAEAATYGVVYAVGSNGFILGDGTGYIYVYQSTSTVGYVVTVKGKVGQYGGCLQFSNATVEQAGVQAVTYPTAQELDGAALDALIAAPAVTFVKVRGTLKISDKYKNLVVEGTENQGSLQVSADVLGEAKDGNEVEVTGFFIYKSGSSTVYGNILATEVKVVGDAPEPTVTEYTKIADVKEAATKDHEKAAFQATDLLVTYVNGKSVYVFDGTDGLLLFASDASLAEGIKAGDKITAKFTGELYLYNGLTEIAFTEVADLTVNSSDNAVEPQKVTIADISNNAKDYENELVQIEGLTAQAEALQSRNIKFMDDSDNELTVRDNWNVLTTATFNTESEYTVTGFVAIYNDAVQVYPRTAEDVDNGEEPVPYELEGEGTLEKPYTAADVQYLLTQEDCPKEAVWVTGYIMGAAKNSMKNVVKEQGDDLAATNIVLADDADEDDNAKMVPVQLPYNEDETKDVRSKLNLVDHFDYLGKQVWVFGTIEKYFSVPGVKNVTDYSLDGESTGLHAVADDAKAEGPIYNIAGQRVSAVGKGLYIVGTKKVLSE